ncbi:MFS transporter [Trebonia kvetii]|uniref:MFS transporter n=1 Tax=Trebonia kvetii TaxID=2480626 RepID=A0A6P2BXX4_9ACTN|nr:MFS transporter [Trebonia kvetii]TVZ03111.1 MFS transporter [Trebonia kvetii]
MLWRAPARRYPVLAIRDFRILLADRLLAPFSAGFSMVGVSFAVLNLTGSTADLSYVLAAQIAPMLVFSLISGVFADRFKPQWVIAAANACIVLGEGTFGVLVLTGHPALWAMIGLETLSGIGIALFYPASQALLPQLVPDALLQEASSISRLAMNTGQMTGAAVAGLVVAAAGPGWALTLCAIGMTGTIPLMFQVKGNVRPVRDVAHQPNMISELREGWTEFRSHTWLWATVIQFCLVMMAFNGGTMVLGPVVARTHLGGPAAWGAITAADAFGLIVGGLISLRYTPRRPMLFVVLTGGTMAIPPLALALVLPLPAICFVAFSIGALAEVMMVQWTVQMATRIPADKLARVSSYDALGSMAAMPIGALAAGPLAAGIGVSATQFASAAVIVVASAFTLIPRDIWTIRNDDIAGRAAVTGSDAAVDGDLAVPDAVLGTGAALGRTGVIASAQAGADLC